MVEHSKHLTKKVDRVVNKTRQSSLLTTLTTVDASWLDAHVLGYYTSVDRNAGTFNFVMDLLHNLFLTSYIVVQQLTRFRLTGHRVVRLQ